MSKKSLDLQYMESALKVKTGVRSGASAVILYGIIRPYILYGIIRPLYGIDPIDYEL